jgi:hypothetical protein
MSKPEEHISFWKMWRQGWVIMWNGCIVFLMPLLLPYCIFTRERGACPIWVEAFLELAGLVYVVFWLPVFVWMLHRGSLRNSAEYRLDKKAKQRPPDDEEESEREA